MPMGKKKVETIEEMKSYREPMQVKEFFVCPGCPNRGLGFNNTQYAYPICPRCDIFFEYEYRAYCSHCGQKLKWTYYYRAKPRYADKK